MRITVLDGYALNPGDLSWEPLQALGELEVYDRCTPGEVIPRAREADALLVDAVEVGAATFAALPQLRYLGLFATGYDGIDLEAARAHGVTVCNVPAYGTASVAQATIALLLALANRACEYDAMVRAGGWRAGGPCHYLSAPLLELEDKLLGVVGFGRIGRAVAALGRAFGMRVLAYSRRVERGTVERGAGTGGEQESDGVELVALDELFRRADVVSLHLPLTAETRLMVGRERLELMKPSAFLINTARGGLVDDAALAAALHAGRPAGAGLDVIGPPEPPEPRNPLLSAPNCIITPHIAWATREARSRCLAEAAANLEAFLSGRARNAVVAPA